MALNVCDVVVAAGATVEKPRGATDGRGGGGGGSGGGGGGGGNSKVVVTVVVVGRAVVIGNCGGYGFAPGGA